MQKFDKMLSKKIFKKFKMHLKKEILFNGEIEQPNNLDI